MSAALTVAGVCATAVAVCAAATTAEPVSFVTFESEILPAWLELFHVPGGALHEYSFFPAPKNIRPTVYGSADVLHVLYSVNQLNLTEPARRGWISHLNSFQNGSGFFGLAPHEEGGWEP